MQSTPVIAAAILFTLVAALPATAATDGDDDARLRETVHRLDQQVFDAFNRCADGDELAKHASYFASDVEFYHDNGGVTWSRDAMIGNTRQHACGRYTRQLVEESFRVSPVKGFGAIATGVHRFCQSDTNQCEGEAEFAMVWRNTDGKWEITRVLSYGHRAATPTPVAHDAGK